MMLVLIVKDSNLVIISFKQALVVGKGILSVFAAGNASCVLAAYLGLNDGLQSIGVLSIRSACIKSGRLADSPVQLADV